MSRNGICPRCGGKGPIWTGSARITCPACNGSGTTTRTVELWRLRDLLYQLVLGKHFWAQFPDWDHSAPVSGSGSRPIYP